MELRYWILCLCLFLTEVSTHHHIDHHGDSESKPAEIIDPPAHNVTENLVQHEDSKNINELSSLDEAGTTINEVQVGVPLSDPKAADSLKPTEGRKRSKIEIKEVNGTLYEYEYIYYYDDDYPMYDYDTVGGDNSTIMKTKTSSDVKTAEEQLTDSTTIAIEPVESVRTRSRQRTQNTLEGKLNNEISSQSLGQSIRQKSRQLDGTSRGRGDPRVIALDNVAAENIAVDLQVENEKLPAQTRFPPRATTPTSEIVKDILVQESDNAIQNTEANKRDHLPSDKSAINLYAFSKVEDNNFVESSTIAKDFDYVTESPNYFDTLYEYDLTPKELDEIELLTTINNTQDIEDATAPSNNFALISTDVYTTNEFIITTEIPATTTTTTTTTTTPPPTTTTTEVSDSRRSFRGRGRFPFSNRGSSRGITNEINGNAESKDPESQATGESPSTTSVHTKRRFGRLNLSGKPSQVGTESSDTTAVTKQVESKPDTTNNVPNRRRLGLQRQRPSLRNKPTSEVSHDATPNANATEEITDEIIKPQLPPPSRNNNLRQRRPLPKNRLNRFNSKTTTSELTESPDNAGAEHVNEPALEGDLVTKEVQDVQDSPASQTDQKNLRKDNNRSHRFNIGNRRKLGNRREKQVVEESNTSHTEQITPTKVATNEEVADVTKKKETTEEVAPPARNNFRRNNNRNLNNKFNHRFRTRGNGNTNPDETETEVSIAHESQQEATPETQEKTSLISESQPAKTAERVSKFSKTNGNNRGERRRTIHGRRQRPSAAQDKEETLPTEAIQEEPQAQIPTDHIAPEEANTDTEAASAIAKPEAEIVLVTEDVTEIIAPETTTEKLTRRQMLAKRRNRFLNTNG